MVAVSTIHTAFPQVTSRCATVIAFTLLFATSTSAKAIPNTAVDTRDVITENMSAKIEIVWEPRKRELTNVMKDRLAATG